MGIWASFLGNWQNFLETPLMKTVATNGLIVQFQRAPGAGLAACVIESPQVSGKDSYTIDTNQVRGPIFF
jgi:hypothetical protein